MSLQFSRNSDGDSVTVSRMEFRPKASDHLREITCRAENTNIRGSAIEDTIRLRVHCKCEVWSPKKFGVPKSKSLTAAAAAALSGVRESRQSWERRTDIQHQ